MPRAAIAIPEPAIRDICRRYSVKELAVFGSALRDDFRPDSDVDFLVEFQPDAPIGFLAFGRMQQELEELVERRVDLVPKMGLKPLIRDTVLADREIIYEA